MRNTALLFLLLAFTITLARAQPDQRGAIWYFGNQAGLRFGSGSPQVLTDGKTGASSGGVSTICDEAGQLLFYADGQTVWNRFHRVVPGASSLIVPGKRQGGSTQNGLLLPHPKNPDWFYVFSIAQPFIDNDRYTIYYSLIDVKANGGEGGVVSTLTLLAQNVVSSLAVVRHCNNRDFWLITHEALGTNKYRTFLLNETGVSTTPIVSTMGSPINDYGPDRAFLKASPDGKRLAMGFYGSASTNTFAEICAFDDKTGQVTQQLTSLEWPSSGQLGIPAPLTGLRSPSDIAFSPNNQYLYATRTYGSYESPLWRSEVYQFNLVTKAYTRLITETFDWNKFSVTYTFAGLENAPDGRLYVSHQGRPFLSVISNPNADGAACGFSEDAISLAGRSAGLYLPFRYPPRRPDPVVTIALKANPNNCNDELTSTVSGFSSGLALHYQWYRNGLPIANATDPTHTVLASGSYSLLVEEVNGCRSKLSDELPVTATNVLSPPAITPVTPVCLGSSPPTLQATGRQIRWYTTQPLSVSVAAGPTFTPSMPTTAPGTYSYYATQTDSKGCTSPADSVVVQVVPRPSLTLTDRQVGLCLETPGASATLQAVSEPGTTFSWYLRGQPVGSQPTLVATTYGQYVVTATDANQCVSRDSVDVLDGCYVLSIPTAFSPNNDQSNETLVAYGRGINQYDIVVYNRWGEVIFTAQHQPFSDGVTIWDGRTGGQYVQPGLYTYQLRLIREQVADHSVMRGTVVVIR